MIIQREHEREMASRVVGDDVRPESPQNAEDQLRKLFGKRE